MKSNFSVNIESNCIQGLQLFRDVLWKRFLPRKDLDFRAKQKCDELFEHIPSEINWLITKPVTCSDHLFIIILNNSCLGVGFYFLLTVISVKPCSVKLLQSYNAPSVNTLGG